MAAIKSFFLLLGLLALSAGTVRADDTQTLSFDELVQQLEQEAIAEGISPETAHAALSEVTLDDRVIGLDQKQPENTVTFSSYSQHTVNLTRVEEGQNLLKKHAAVLKKISALYGVQPQVIIALWGIESSFGRHSGDYNIVNSLATLIYDGRRAEFFHKQLMDALHILDQEHMQASELLGSWAGALGQCQFMPSTYLKYAIDYDNTGHRDIWTNTDDVFASIANYLASEGWTSELTWGREVELKKPLAAQYIGLDNKLTLAEWAKLGVRSANGGALPNRPLEASLVQPDGMDGRSFLVYDNFRALMKWNRSTYFATSVGLLADRIK